MPPSSCPLELLRIRPSKEVDPARHVRMRGPFYAESAIAALHALPKGEGRVSLEMAMDRSGTIAFYVRGSAPAARLAESQLYAQYPDIDIQPSADDPLLPRENEELFVLELRLKDPEVFPIKRHPQFDDLLNRVNVDPIAGISATLAGSPVLGMRSGVQVILEPLTGNFRKRALRFLPLLRKGISGVSGTYAKFFARVQLARGWRRLAYFPIACLMGGFRAWPGVSASVAVPALADAPASGSPDDRERVTTRSHDREDSIAGAQDKVNRLLFVCSIRLVVLAPAGHQEVAMAKLREIAGSFQQFALPQSNSFVAGPPRKVSGAGLLRMQNPVLHPGRSFILSVEEVATLWHMPTALVQTPAMDWVLSKKLEPPINLPIPGVTDPPDALTIMGEAVFRGTRSRFGMRADDRRRHIYIIGKTGMGKSTLLENMIFADIHAGRGVGVMDPHGDLLDAVLRMIPKERTNDVVLFDPSDRDFPISFNILESRDADQRALVTSGIMSVFLKLWPDVWSGRMEHILRNTLLALLETEGSSMLGITRMFADSAYRSRVVARLSDPLVRSFWEDEYGAWSEKYRTEAVAAIQNKVGQLLSTPLIRNIVGQVSSTLDIRHAMDTGKIILVNLSKGKLGEDTSAFLGSMLVTKFQIDAMSRADMPERDRRDFFLYVDEFQNFATESFATILSEARKYRLSLTMANQYVSQLLIGDANTKLRDAVFGNVGTLVSFQVGSDDAESLSLQFEEMVQPKDILSLPKYNAYVRLMIDGIPSKPFSMVTLPPPQFVQDAGRTDVIRKLSRQRYSEKRSVVEEKIRRWTESAKESRVQGRSAEKAREKEEEEKKRAKAKNMTLDQYRAWRDREMWTNDFNALRKREMLGEQLTDADRKQMAELEQKLRGSGGVPPPSKTLLEEVRKKQGGA